VVVSSAADADQHADAIHAIASTPLDTALYRPRSRPPDNYTCPPVLTIAQGNFPQAARFRRGPSSPCLQW
jgi:hypothetical protein